jgi:N-acetyl sugar amidotransferase
MNTQNNTVCSFCVMDTSVPDIIFDKNKQCQFCKNHKKRIIFEQENYPNYLEKLTKNIKEKSTKDKYDCIIGVSGGVDSTYVAYYIKKVLKLNPLAVHLDNGWNSELAVKNIENCLNVLEIDLITHVIDWNEFKKIQKALLKSSINNLEIVTDHAINALLIKTAAKYKIKHIINGSNTSTEGIMPSSWMEANQNKQLIKSIYKKFYPNHRIKSVPTISFLEFFYYLLVKKIKFVPILNFIEYNKENVIEILKKEIDYKPYRYKHYESIITRFFQGYILPEKFSIDKRKAHFSSLIVSGQMSRDEALEKLKEHPYGDTQVMERDKLFFLKKLELDKIQFKKIMENQPSSASLYAPYSIKFLNFIGRFNQLLRKLTR